MKVYPTRPDPFNMISVIDYPALFAMQAGENKVVSSKKKYLKESNTKTKTTMHRMQNK